MQIGVQISRDGALTGRRGQGVDVGKERRRFENWSFVQNASDALMTTDAWHALQVSCLWRVRMGRLELSCVYLRIGR